MCFGNLTKFLSNSKLYWNKEPEQLIRPHSHAVAREWALCMFPSWAVALFPVLTCSCSVTLPASLWAWSRARSPLYSCCCVSRAWGCWSALCSISFTTFTFRRLRRVMAALPESPLWVILQISASHLKDKAYCTFKYFGHLRLVWLKLEGGQETQRAQVKGHDRRNAVLQGQFILEKRKYL